MRSWNQKDPKSMSLSSSHLPPPKRRPGHFPFDTLDHSSFPRLVGSTCAAKALRAISHLDQLTMSHFKSIWTISSDVNDINGLSLFWGDGCSMFVRGKCSFSFLLERCAELGQRGNFALHCCLFKSEPCKMLQSHIACLYLHCTGRCMFICHFLCSAKTKTEIQHSTISSKSWGINENHKWMAGLLGAVFCPLLAPAKCETFPSWFQKGSSYKLISCTCFMLVLDQWCCWVSRFGDATVPHLRIQMQSSTHHYHSNIP